jgi:membrane peptidoglycan carboxypeptidase
MTPTLTILRRRRARRDLTRRSTSQRSQRTAFAVGFAISAAVVVAVLAAALAYASLTSGLPSLGRLSILLDPQDGLLLQPTRLYDRSGVHLLATLAPSDQTRVFLSYDQFPQVLVDATLALAQPDFWSSPGYVTAGWESADVHPTVAQQLVYSLLLWNRPASTERAIQERILAAEATAEFGRQQILTWYLNSADYGHDAFGAEAAAQFYFGKSATQLSLSEAAMLAAVSQAPALNPLDAPQAAESRRQETLRSMQELGWIDAAAAASAIQTPPTIVGRASSPGLGLLDSSAIAMLLDQLDTALGADNVERGGMLIRTTLDYDLQLQTSCTLQNELAKLSSAPVQDLPAADGSACQAASLLETPQTGTSLPQPSAAALILDPVTGQVLAAAGDLSNHPAGTSITPFIYLTGFAGGLGPATLGWDIPGQTPALGQVYHGPVRLRVAMVNDYLPPALTVLDQMGNDSVNATAAPFGLELPTSNLMQDDFNLTPLELASAYGVFAAQGTRAGQISGKRGLQASMILQVMGADHALWLDWSQPQRQAVLSPQLVYLINDVLSDDTARWATMGQSNPLEIGRPAAAKLSRTLDSSGGWTVGYTPQLVTAVWMGGSTRGAGAPLLSADAWNALTRYAVQDLPSEGWEMPSGVVTVSVCDPSGLLPTAYCPDIVSEIFLDGRQPVQTDNLYQAFMINTETGLLATVFTPPDLVEQRVYLVVPAQAQAWAQTAGIPQPPTQYDTLQLPDPLPDANITSPIMFADSAGQIQIDGTASGTGFASYRLEYGAGLFPQVWVQIGQDSTSPVTDGKLEAWDTRGLNGLYSLRLMVVHHDSSLEQALVMITLDNTPPVVRVLFPQNGQEIELSQNPQIALQAQVSEDYLSQVQFFLDDRLMGASQAAPFGVVWPASRGKHTLRVVATDLAGNTGQASVQFTVK